MYEPSPTLAIALGIAIMIVMTLALIGFLKDDEKDFMTPVPTTVVNGAHLIPPLVVER